MNFKQTTYLWYVALPRIYIGYYFLQQGVRKFQRDFPHGNWIGRQIGEMANADLYRWYEKFLLSYVAPHHELFGYLGDDGRNPGRRLFAAGLMHADCRVYRPVHGN